MSTQPEKAISQLPLVARALVTVLRPLVRFLLRAGVSYNVFADVAKWVFVEVAQSDFGIPGRKQTKSRIAVLTGLPRRQVQQLVDAAHPPYHEDGATDDFNRAARVLTGWGEADTFTDDHGTAMALALDDSQSPSFAEVVKEFGGDAPHRAILDELLRVGAVEVDDEEMVHRRKPYYVPQPLSPEFLDIFAMSGADLFATLDHNAMHGQDDESRFQRLVYGFRLRRDKLPELQQKVRELGQPLADELDQYITRLEDRPTQMPPQEGYVRAGLGLYFFQSDDKHK